MLVQRCARFGCLLAGLVLLIGVVACGGSGSSPAPSAVVAVTNVATPVDADFNVTGVDPSRLCFNASTLPANFVADGNAVMNSVTDAAAKLRASGMRVHIVGEDLPWLAADHPALDPVAMLVPAYLGIEAAARAAGLDPDRPPQLSKVTMTL